MKVYEDSKFNDWRVEIQSILPDLLKTNLLIKPKNKHDLNLALPQNTDPETGNYNCFL
jgi:hypothetical protein